MGTNKVKKSTINKMTEYPVIGLDEQMDLKGGTGNWWTKVLDWANSILGLGESGNGHNTTTYGNGSPGSMGGPFSKNTIYVNGVQATPGMTIYGTDSIKVVYPDGRTVIGYGADSLRIGN